jgi:hypothetical protein
MFFSGRTPKKKAIVGYLRMRNTAFERFNPVPKLRIREEILNVYCQPSIYFPYPISVNMIHCIALTLPLLLPPP